MASTARPEGRPPGPHPDPLPDLATFDLPLSTTRQPWFRCHPAGLDPIYFGRSRRHRFDAPGAEFGILYAAADAHCAFIETFGHETGEVDFVTLEALAARGLCRLEPRRELRLVELSGAGLARLKADARLTSGSIAIAQLWALALFEHPEQADGIIYRSRHDPDRLCVAIFDRARDSLAASPLGSFADPSQARLLASVLEDYGLGLIDR